MNDLSDKTNEIVVRGNSHDEKAFHTCQAQNRRYKALVMILKTVTLQEANGLLPLVREHFLRIHVMLAELQKRRGHLSPKNHQHFTLDKTSENIVIIKKRSGHKKNKASPKGTKEVERLIEKEINQLMKLGAVIKGLLPPHIDFLSMRNNEPIFLCWHGGESEIKHWHYLDDGAPFRQVIAKKSRFGPHMVH